MDKSQFIAFALLKMIVRTQLPVFAPLFLLMTFGLHSHAASSIHGLDDILSQTHSEGAIIHRHSLNVAPLLPFDVHRFLRRYDGNMHRYALNNITRGGDFLRSNCIVMSASLLERVFCRSYDSSAEISESPALPRHYVDENCTLERMSNSSLQTENLGMESFVSTAKHDTKAYVMPVKQISNVAQPVTSDDMNHTPFLREVKRNGTARRRKKQKAKMQPPSISMTTASKIHTTLPVLESVVHHVFAFVTHRIPQLIVFLKLVANLLFLLLRAVYTTMTTVVIPFAKKEWQKYHPLILLFCIQQQHTLIKHCTFLYIMVTKMVEKWSIGNIPEETGPVGETAIATSPSFEIDRPVGEPVMPYYLHAFATENPELLPNISVTESVATLNGSVVADNDKMKEGSSQDAVVESVETSVADWNDSITALVIRLSLIAIMCVLIAISQ